MTNCIEKSNETQRTDRWPHPVGELEISEYQLGLPRAHLKIASAG